MLVKELYSEIVTRDPQTKDELILTHPRFMNHTTSIPSIPLLYIHFLGLASISLLREIYQSKVEKILKGSLDSIPSPSPSVKIQIMGGKVCLRCKGKTLLGIVNKLLKTKSLLTSPSNVLPYYLK